MRTVVAAGAAIIEGGGLRSRKGAGIDPWKSGAEWGTGGQRARHCIYSAQLNLPVRKPTVKNGLARFPGARPT